MLIILYFALLYLFFRLLNSSILVVDFYRSKIYSTKIKWPIGSFIVNKHTIIQSYNHKTEKWISLRFIGEWNSN